jgi:hypothetical protein
MVDLSPLCLREAARCGCRMTTGQAQLLGLPPARTPPPEKNLSGAGKEKSRQK